ncbi:hypothetical protein [Halorubellus sp. PRR65]|uniref:hypothetical protein n=1 Tax=Halorubellus sp. PRR65 TaxID=3098148 RepID=UPI002B25E573|nr:hypothetical protein [Halorubellus sp. PRR65]
MTAGDGLGEMQRLLSEDFGARTGRGTPESISLVLLGLFLAGAIGCAVGYYGPGLPADHSVNLAVPYAALAMLLYVFSVAAGPVHVLERLLASATTFAWFYAMVLDGHVVRRTVDADPTLSILVPATVVVVAVAHLTWRSGVLDGLRWPRDVYPRTRNLALIYAPTIYFATWDVATAL